MSTNYAYAPLGASPGSPVFCTPGPWGSALIALPSRLGKKLLASPRDIAPGECVTIEMWTGEWRIAGEEGKEI